MAVEVYSNDGVATVSGSAAAVSAGTVQTWTISGSTLPAVSSSGGTCCYVCDPFASSEKILVTNISGSTATVTRGADGTTPVSHSSGFTIRQVLTRASYEGFQQAVQPSGDTSGATDAANINAAVAAIPSTGGTVRLAATGTWYVECGVVSIDRSGVYIDARGCYISAVGTGDVFRMYDNSGTFWPVYGGGLTGFPVIDATSAGAGSCAVHLGDMFQPVVEAAAQNFTGTGSIAFHFDNANYWTEGLRGRLYSEKCTAAVVFDVTGATTSTASFARTDLDIYINQVNATYDGIVVQNGALIYDGSLRVRGNFVGSTSALTSAAFRVTGTVPGGHPSAGSYSGIYDCRMDVGLECAANTYTPVTFAFGANNNTLKNCYGILDFGTDGAAANFTGTARLGNVSPFFGVTNGDYNLTTGAQGFQDGIAWGATGGLSVGDYTSAVTLSSSGTISTSNGGSGVRALKRVTMTAAVTGMIISAGSFDGQTFWIMNESAFTATFAASGTSHVAGGTGVVLPPYSQTLFLFDGADTNLWYAQISMPWYVNGSGQAASPFPVLLPAGTATAAPANYQSGTLLTTAAAGATEYDGTCFYDTAQASSRQVRDTEQFMALTTTYTLATGTGLQKLFNGSTNGAVTVQASTSYFFECEFDLASMATASGNFSFGFGGTAGITSLKYTAVSEKSASGGLTTVTTPQFVGGTAAAAQLLVSQTATNTTAGTARIRGIVRINATGGTLIPQIALGVSTSTAVVGTNSFFRIWPVGSNTVVNVGDWS